MVRLGQDQQNRPRCFRNAGSMLGQFRDDGCADNHDAPKESKRTEFLPEKQHRYEHRNDRFRVGEKSDGV